MPSKPSPVRLFEPSRRHEPKPFRSVGRAAWWLLLVFALIVAGGAWWWTKGRNGAAGTASVSASAPVAGPAAAGARRFGGANRVQPVSVQAAERRRIRQRVDAIGSIAASNTAIVRAQVSGVLQALSFREGQQVQAGQRLAQIDPRAFQAALAQAEGNLARDRAQLDNARIDSTRYADLVAKDAAPKQQLETQQALVRQLEGTLAADQAAVSSARLQLGYTRVTAPLTGRVGLKQADIGNVVSPADANGIVTIAQTRPAALVFAVPAANVPLLAGRLKANEPVPVEAWSRDGKTRLATGRLATLDNAIDASTDTIRLKAVFPNDDEALFPNQAVSVRLQLATLEDALAVPSAALLRGAQGFYVYVVGNDNNVAMRVVTPGAVDGDWTAVDGAVRPGERVVIDGVDRLRDGAKVEVIAADPRLRAGASAPAAGGNRQRMIESLPPEVAAKVQAMSPDEKREFFRQRRAAGAASGATSGAASRAAP